MRRHSGLLGACLAASMVFAACGGDDDDGGSAGGGGDGRGEKVSAAAFADDLCGRLTEFAAGAKKSVEKEGVKEVLGEGAPKADITQLPKIIGALTEMFGDLDGQFASLAEDLKEIGVPDVEGGAEFRTTLLDAMTKGADLIGQAAEKLEDTDPDSLGDLSALAPAFSDFDKAFGEVNIDFQDKAPKEVAAAIKDSKACKDFEKDYGEL